MGQTLAVVGSIPWFGWVAIIAVISGSFTGMLNAWYTHRERIEMIRHGMHPDANEAKSRVLEL